jgi:hypothetical protein
MTEAWSSVPSLLLPFLSKFFFLFIHTSHLFSWWFIILSFFCLIFYGPCFISVFWLSLPNLFGAKKLNYCCLRNKSYRWPIIHQKICKGFNTGDNKEENARTSKRVHIIPVIFVLSAIIVSRSCHGKKIWTKFLHVLTAAIEQVACAAHSAHRLDCCLVRTLGVRAV